MGAPNPKLTEGMRAEHTQGPGTESGDMFLTQNYGVYTCSRAEWAFTVDADATPEQIALERWPEGEWMPRLESFFCPDLSLLAADNASIPLSVRVGVKVTRS